MYTTLHIKAQRIWAVRATDGLSFDARIMRTPNAAAAPDDPRTQDQRDITRCRVECDRVVQGADGCTMVTGASDSIGRPDDPAAAALHVQRRSATPAVLHVGRADSASSSRLVGTLALHCSGALLADLCL